MTLSKFRRTWFARATAAIGRQAPTMMNQTRLVLSELRDATDYVARAKSLLADAVAEPNQGLALMMAKLGDAFLECAETLIRRADAAMDAPPPAAPRN